MLYILNNLLVGPGMSQAIRSGGYLTHLPPGQNGHLFADDVFKCIFLNENIWISNRISLIMFIEMRSLGSNWQYVSIGSDNGLALSRWQAIIWTNADPFHWHIYVALGEDELSSVYQFNFSIGTNSDYDQTSNISCTESPKLNVSWVVLQLPLPHSGGEPTKVKCNYICKIATH